MGWFGGLFVCLGYGGRGCVGRVESGCIEVSKVGGGRCKGASWGSDNIVYEWEGGGNGTSEWRRIHSPFSNYDKELRHASCSQSHHTRRILMPSSRPFFIQPSLFFPQFSKILQDSYSQPLSTHISPSPQPRSLFRQFFYIILPIPLPFCRRK